MTTGLVRHLIAVGMAAMLTACASGYLERTAGPIEYGTVRAIENERAGASNGHEADDKTLRPQSRVSVHLDSGNTLVVEQPRDMELRVGHRVRVRDDHVDHM